jgi:hypothetical protein
MGIARDQAGQAGSLPSKLELHGIPDDIKIPLLVLLHGAGVRLSGKVFFFDRF